MIKTNEKCRCLECGEQLDAATSNNEPDAEVLPSEGDVSICFSCGNVAIFTDKLFLRPPNNGESREIENSPEIKRAVKMILNR